MGDLKELVERLRTPHTLDIRDIVHVRALLDLVAVERTEAADAITALIAERDALAKRLDHYIGMHGANIRTGRRLVLRERARAEAAEAQLKAARETLEKLACRHVTEQPLWWQLEARAALSTKEG